MGVWEEVVCVKGRGIGLRMVGAGWVGCGDVGSEPSVGMEVWRVGWIVGQGVVQDVLVWCLGGAGDVGGAAGEGEAPLCGWWVVIGGMAWSVLWGCNEDNEGMCCDVEVLLLGPPSQRLR
jgi:hypothetical protein